MRNKKLLTLIGSIFLILVLAAMPFMGACAPEEEVTPPPEEEKPTPTAAYGPEWDKIVAAARAEGVLTGYASYFCGEQGQDIQETFGREYGIEVKGVTGMSEALSERIKTEAAIGKQICDVSGFTSSTTLRLVDAGFVEEVASKLPELSVLTEDDWDYDPIFADGMFVAFGGTVWGPVINTDLVRGEDVPTSWFDLLDPKWDGKMVIGSPTMEGSAYYMWLLMSKAGFSDKEREDYFRKLGQQHLAVRACIYEVLDAVSKGEYALTVAGYVQYVEQKSPLGVPIMLCPMKEWARFTTGNFAMIKGCPHPNAALVFINWALTKEGMDVIATSNRFCLTARKDSPNSWRLDCLTTGKPVENYMTLNVEEIKEFNELKKSGLLEELLGLPSLK